MQLHFKEFGQSEPLIILHGLFGSSDNWLGVAPKLAEKFHAFAPDLRNHGQSPSSGEMNYSMLAGDVEEFLDARNLKSANVIGHSMGGKVAMRFALNFPARVKKLVVVDIAPRAYASEHEKTFAALLALDLSSFQTRQQAEDALAQGIPNLGVRRFLLKNLGRNLVGEFFWKINLRGLAENYPCLGEALAASTPFAKPTLFLCGGKSDYVRKTDVPLIRKLFSQAKIETIPEARHWVHADAPDEFVRRVLKFLQAA